MFNELTEIGGSDRGNDIYAAGDIDIELKTDGETAGNPESAFLATFQKTMDSTRKDLKTIRKNIADLEAKYKRMAGEVEVLDRKKTMRDECTKLRKESAAGLNAVKEVLATQEKGLKTMKESLISQAEDPAKWATAEYRVRETVYQGVLKEFAEVVEKLNTVEAEYRASQRSEIRRKLEIVKDDKEPVTEEQVEQFVKNPRQSVFLESLQKSSAMVTIKTEYEVALETREELLQLETSFNELHEMFRDLFMIVQMQGDLVDSIEGNVAHAADFVAKGQKAVHEAKEHSKKGKLCIVIGIIVLVGIVALAVVVGLALLFGVGGALGMFKNV